MECHFFFSIPIHIFAYIPLIFRFFYFVSFASYPICLIVRFLFKFFPSSFLVSFFICIFTGFLLLFDFIEHFDSLLLVVCVSMPWEPNSSWIIVTITIAKLLQSCRIFTTIFRIETIHKNTMKYNKENDNSHLLTFRLEMCFSRFFLFQTKKKSFSHKLSLAT